ncbi:MAG TPA: PLD nuclease N-terminal domain-containing protein [Rariglobus sp.]|nr:PLD nuclease N-terminal domain-containing protein [Rariglobus sp.]
MSIDQAAGFFGGFAFSLLALLAFFATLGLLLSIFWVWMLVDCANAPMPSGDKTAWILILLFTHILGAILYYFIPRRDRLRVTSPFVAPPATPPAAS